MRKDKVTLISTVLNEEKNINFFIKSIIDQSKKPDEFIIIDGGSTDKTFEILKSYSRKNKRMKVFQEKGTNIPRGRNIAISKAKNEIIVSVDAGTKYEKEWLENLIKGFKEDVGFGKTLPWIKNNFQKILSKKMKQRFGSSRNMIFKKSVWKEVGGYPEDMKIAEDTVFYEKIRRGGFKMDFIPNAICDWEMRDNIRGLEKQFYNYGYWGGLAYKRHSSLPLKRKLAVIILILLLPLFPLFWLISRLSLSIKISCVMRFSYLKGFLRGFFNIKG